MTMIGGITRYCPWCGTAFTETGRHERYCSQVCRKKFNAHKEQAEEKGNMITPAIRICKTCGKLFVTRCGGKKYCSDKCRYYPDEVRAKMGANNVQ